MPDVLTRQSGAAGPGVAGLPLPLHARDDTSSPIHTRRRLSVSLVGTPSSVHPRSR